MSEAHMFIGLVWAVTTLGLWTLLYRLGGWAGQGKYWRRYVAGIGLPLSLNGLAIFTGQWTPWLLTSLAIFPVWLSLGYGGDTTGEKAIRRLVYAIGASAAAGAILVPLGLWGSWMLQTLISIAVTLWYGLKNPLSATGEEGLLAACYVVLVVFAPLR